MADAKELFVMGYNGFGEPLVAERPSVVTSGFIHAVQPKKLDERHVALMDFEPEAAGTTVTWPLCFLCACLIPGDLVFANGHSFHPNCKAELDRGARESKAAVSDDTVMDPPRQAHLEGIVEELTVDLQAKYIAGQLEHGGNLWEKAGMLDGAIAEVLDLAIYLYTLRRQLRRVI